MDMTERGLEILKELGLNCEWHDQTHDLIDIIDPVTGNSTCREPYGVSRLLDFLMRTGKLRLGEDATNFAAGTSTSPVDGSATKAKYDKEAFLAEVEELNKIAESFGNSVSCMFGRLEYWRHRHPINPKDKASTRIFTSKDALDPKREHREARWYFDRDEITELRKTILYDKAIYARYFTIKD